MTWIALAGVSAALSGCNAYPRDFSSKPAVASAPAAAVVAVVEPAPAPSPAVAKAEPGAADLASTGPYDLHGFEVFEDDGRLWVFRAGSEHLATYKTKGEPAKRVTLVAEGPQGKTLLGSDTADLQDYAASFRYGAPGFAVYAESGRLWVFRRGSSAHQTYLAKGEPAKRVTLVGEGPDGTTLLGAERATLDSYRRAVSR